MDTTLVDGGYGAEPRAADALCLLLMTPGGFTAHALPRSGTLIIGRAADADIRLFDPRASRRHAALRVGDTLSVEDLGSGNGTRVRGTWIEAGSPIEMNVGEAIVIGSVCLMIERADNPAATTGVWSHSTFESRANALCTRARAQGASFGVGHLRVDRTALWTEIVPPLVRVFRGPHLLAAYGANEYQILFTETDPEGALRLIADAKSALREIGVTARTGLAWFPRDGRSLESLVERAHAQTLDGSVATERKGELPPTRSPEVQAVYDAAQKAASGNINVLVLGETGVGKEVLAQAVHRLSTRRDGHMLCLNCAGLGELLESELFGYERGAFTGASQAKPGLLETAHKGTVFLDEVGELTLAIQAKLLRVIDRREVTRLGGLKPRAIDVRFISATNRDLEEEARRGRFRSDLLFRLNGISLEIPPLRARAMDLLPLCNEFLAEAAAEQEREPTLRLSTEAFRALQSYDWPGNIRELRNVIGRAVLLSNGDEILPEHLPLARMRRRVTGAFSAEVTSEVTPTSNAANRNDTDAPSDPRAIERSQIIEALAACAGNQSRAARMLGIPRRTFVSRLQSYGIPRPQKP